jgi:dTDP-4-dehydrorhamnose 3,5-epimerase
MSYKELKVEKSKIFDEVLIIRPSVQLDLRGNIFTSYNHNIYQSEILPQGVNFIHDKFATSRQNVLRGIHGDNKTWKLVSCVFGEIYEVVVDMRPESSKYLKWEGFILNAEKYQQILIPPRFGNGYYVKTEIALFHYKLAYDGAYIDADEQFTIAWNDNRLKIDWPGKDPILQDRDKIII